MPPKHRFVSSVADVGGPTYVQPTHWNDGHYTPPFLAFDWDPAVAPASFGIPSTAGPTGFEFLNNTVAAGRDSYVFTHVDSLQLVAALASIANGPPNNGSAALRFQYMASGFPGSWYSFDATGGSGPFVALATAHNASLYLASANGPRLSPTVAVSAAAKALPQPLTTRIAGYGGNGSAVNLGNISVFAF